MTTDFPSFSDTGVQLPIRPEGIAFDLDGTLLDYSGNMSESVAKAVRLIARSGIKVFLITGRQESATVRFWEELCLDTAIATCNGACVGFPGREPAFHIRLSEKARNTVVELDQKHGYYVNYYIDNHIYALHDSPERDWYTAHFSPVELRHQSEDILELRLPTKCVCIAPEAEQAAVTEVFAGALGDEVCITRSNERFIEILPPGANKGAGLRALAEMYGIPLERLIAVGDAMNDLPMLTAAGFAISFKSGDPRLAEHVDMMLPPLWEDGMELLAKCVLGMTGSGRFLTARSTRFFKNRD